MGACLDFVEEACISKSYLTCVVRKSYLTRVVYELRAIKI